MKRTLMILLPILVLAVSGLGAWIIILNKPKMETRLPDPPPPLIRVHRVELVELPMLVTSQGTVKPRTESKLAPEISGRVLWVSPRFASGGFFEKDEVLLKIDPVDYELAVSSARAEVAARKLALAREEAEAEVAEQEWKDLGKGEATPLTLRIPQLEDARASLAAAEAAVKQAERNLVHTQVKAPYEGRIREKMVDVGEFINRGSPAALIYSVDCAEVRLPLPDNQLAFLDLPLDYRGQPSEKEGPAVTLSADFAGRIFSWEGRIVRTEGAIDAQSRMVQAVAQVRDPYRRSTDKPGHPPMAVGMYVTASIQGRTESDVAVLPRAALHDGNRVLVVDEEMKLRYREVDLLRVTRNEIVVRAGLEPGEEVCLSTMEAITDGMEVRILGRANPAPDESESAEPAEPGAESEASEQTGPGEENEPPTEESEQQGEGNSTGGAALMKTAIDWFAKNPVAANLLMAVIMAGGMFTVFGIKQEVFPEFSMDMITITVEYLGAAPEEVEEGVCVRVEEAIQGLEGIKRITSTAAEGLGTVIVELELGEDVREVLDDIKNRVDAIDTFPEETEKPLIREATNRFPVINVAVWGDGAETTLKFLAEQVRDEIAALPGITQVELAGDRPYEISIEVAEDALRRYGITFDFVAMAVRRSSLDLPGGSVKTRGGEILLRTKGQAYRGREFEELVLLTRPDGTRLTLGEVATVKDAFAETDQSSRFEGKPAILVQTYRTGDQSAIDIVDTINEYLVTAQPRMPEGITLTTWQDQSKVLKDRLDLLLRNGRNGFILVFMMLTLFLRFRLAFWVSLGIPISFLGVLWLMPGLDVSINLISLFAFIVVLGIVVDDAIIVGENIFTHQRKHGNNMKAAMEGALEVSVPVIFAVLTSVAAFYPLLAIEGTMGKIMGIIPMVVIPCLAFSLVESLLILPAHLGHSKEEDLTKKPNLWQRFQGSISKGLKWWIDNIYSPCLEMGLRWRYFTVALGLATLILTVGIVKGGWIQFFFFPPVDAEYISAELTMPQGTPVEITSQIVAQLEDSAELMRREMEERTGQDQFHYVNCAIGVQPYAGAQARGLERAGGQPSASHLGEVLIELMPAENRTVTAKEMANRWRELTGKIPDVVELSFNSSMFKAGDDVDVQLTGAKISDLRAVSALLKERLAAYPGVEDIADSFREGKREIKLKLKPEAEVMGLTLFNLARQVRQAFYGEEVQRIQRGRDDIRVMVRYPEEKRRSLGDMEDMRIRTPDGYEVPFSEVAAMEPGRGFASIKRVDRRRAVNVTAGVETENGGPTPGDIVEDLQAQVLPEILADYPGVYFSFEGQQAQQRDTIEGLIRGFALAMLIIYALLAVPLKSYVQPFIIMLAIPFGVVGAIWGHMIMGLDLTILSMFGLVALAGVVVNDSLVMVDFINRNLKAEGDLHKAVRMAGAVRFRPILLTSLTTFAGLLPLLLEKSMQARFLVPMAVSLAFGVLFSTFITLMLVPAGYLILEDLKKVPGWLGKK